ncbi:unnamed protein product [Heligmosomoides polygyrus]|uniref:CSD domain-containing protein n=1 Tax=Heligmosomoides polygyrus TaxID=6339 RepID=A0A3P8BGG7_HELPZ|nr:unnamed protein product [Heligmosomoides polygyrus]
MDCTNAPDSLQLRTSVKAVEGCPGLFKSDQFGFIDDPSGVLALLHLSAYQRSSVVVTLEDKPSHHAEMRFRIVDVQPDKAAKLEKWMKENEIVVNDAKGVAINESTVYSKDHANIFFEVPDDLRSDFSPGQMVTFSAQYHNDTKKFLVTKICAMPGDGVTFVERTVPGHEAPQKVFRVEAERMKHLNSFLNSSVFGLLDVAKPLSLPGGKRKPLTVWVRQSLPGPEETTRPHHTSFVVVSIGEEEPKDEVVAPSVAEESPSEEPKEEVQEPCPEPESPSEEQIRRAMERLGLIGDTNPVITHEPECTPIKCAASCETWKAVLMLDTVPNFWEILAAKNPVFFTECVNKLFS